MNIWRYRLSGIAAGPIVGGALVLGITACDSQAGTVSAEAEVYKRADQLYVTHDAGSGVTCWSRNANSATLSCLPDWMMIRPEPLKPTAIWPAGEPCHDDAICIGFDKRRRALAGDGAPQ